MTKEGKKMSRITSEIIKLHEIRLPWKREKDGAMRPYRSERDQNLKPINEEQRRLRSRLAVLSKRAEEHREYCKGKLAEVEREYQEILKTAEGKLTKLLKDRGMNPIFPEGTLAVDIKVLSGNRYDDCEYREECLNVACYEDKVRGPSTFSCKECELFPKKEEFLAVEPQ